MQRNSTLTTTKHLLLATKRGWLLAWRMGTSPSVAVPPLRARSVARCASGFPASGPSQFECAALLSCQRRHQLSVLVAWLSEAVALVAKATSLNVNKHLLRGRRARPIFLPRRRLKVIRQLCGNRRKFCVSQDGVLGLLRRPWLARRVEQLLTRQG